MKLLHDLFHQAEPLFHKGGKLERLYPVFEATESFFFTSDKVTSSTVHVRDALDNKRLMISVVLALVPCVLFGAYNVGLQRLLATGQPTDLFSCFFLGFQYILPIIFVSYAVGGFWETLFAVVRGEEITEGFLVSGLLFPLTLPPTIPLWQVALGISFGVVIGKEVFGGVGMNILNPALTARAFLFFAYPGNISGDRVWSAVSYGKDTLVDGYSGATALGVLAIAPGDGPAVLEQAGFTWMDAFLGFIPGSIGETSAALIFAAGLLMIFMGVASWRTMLATLVGTAFMASVLNCFSSVSDNALLSLPFYWHYVLGGFAFGTVYMATDPVSSASTKTGKWVYGFFIGVLLVLIRAVNPAYPEGVMLAILFMNVFAPLIDYTVVRKNVSRRLARG